MTNDKAERKKMAKLTILEEVAVCKISEEISRMIVNTTKSICTTAVENRISIEHVKVSLGRVMMKAISELDPVQLVNVAARVAVREHIASLEIK